MFAQIVEVVLQRKNRCLEHSVCSTIDAHNFGEVSSIYDSLLCGELIYYGKT